ncbi:MAG TPA: secretin N-terminal domain-containing protein, partial [Burkholderiales bacterium]|nr:secretin N-terminal domain-containing protein [Burkholderiales bacterium]
MRRNRLRVLAALAAAALAPAFGEQQVLEVIELRYRSAEEVIPILTPLLAPGATVSGMQNKLVIRTTPSNLAGLRKVLDVVDGAPKRLLITVRQETSASGAGTDLDVSGGVGAGADSLQAGVVGIRADRAGAGTRTAQVLEGNAVFIQLGQSAPVRTRRTRVLPGGAVQEIDSVEYHDVDAGFYAQPRVSGDRVTIQLAARRDAVLDNGGGAVRIQSVGSVATGRLGEWIEIGGIAREEVRDERATIHFRSAGTTERARTFIKSDQQGLLGWRTTPQREAANLLMVEIDFTTHQAMGPSRANVKGLPE